jgi:hypothetical protein
VDREDIDITARLQLASYLVLFLGDTLPTTLAAYRNGYSLQQIENHNPACVSDFSCAFCYKYDTAENGFYV